MSVTTGNAYLPIGVFDSGLGGLTVLKALAQALPQENFVYLGDTARLPYGSKSTKTICAYTAQNLKYLIDRKVKAVVVACNSASTVLDMLDYPGLPVFGVLKPGARAALKNTQNHRIGVLATKATIASHAYLNELKSLDPHVECCEQAGPLLVPLVEEGLAQDPLTNLIVYRYVHPLVACEIDTLILGCTHYPVLKAAIYKVTGPNVILVDSAETISRDLAFAINNGEIPKNPSPQRTSIKIFTTDHSDDFSKIAKRLLQPLETEPIQQVDL